MATVFFFKSDLHCKKTTLKHHYYSKQTMKIASESFIQRASSMGAPSMFEVTLP